MHISTFVAEIFDFKNIYYSVKYEKVYFQHIKVSYC